MQNIISTRFTANLPSSPGAFTRGNNGNFCAYEFGLPTPLAFQASFVGITAHPV